MVRILNYKENQSSGGKEKWKGAGFPGPAAAAAVTLFYLAVVMPLQAQPQARPNENRQVDRDRRDPFVSPLDKEMIREKEIAGISGLAASIVLNGILWSEKAPLAIVNNKVLAEGDRLNRFKVKKITREKIILEYKGKEIELFLDRKEAEGS